MGGEVKHPTKWQWAREWRTPPWNLHQYPWDERVVKPTALNRLRWFFYRRWTPRGWRERRHVRFVPDEALHTITEEALYETWDWKHSPHWCRFCDQMGISPRGITIARKKEL